MADNTADIDTNNREFQISYKLISDTTQSVFLSGKAGTGKSTFIRHICANIQKKYILLAPTGIAAVNVGGMTLHSFFKIPFKPLLPDDPEYIPSRIKRTLKLPKEKVKIINELELIIIDEISMVRADIIDFIDKVLRVYSKNMREPFGGKQLLLVGDLFQLEPVVTADMRDILIRYYKNFFFFNAEVFNRTNLVSIELTKVYRQTDSKFISLLNDVRSGQISRAELDLINRRYIPGYDVSSKDFIITLATRRDTVDSINETFLSQIESPEHTFYGDIDGTFPIQNLPTAQELTLKVGAQIIFIRNDREHRWINGTIGRVSEIMDDGIIVALEDGKSYSIEPEQWENIQYEYDDKKKQIKETILGTFKQLPIKLAWALTIHKSQGLTFNNVIIDLSGGAFSSGQTYVALSRCTSLEGIILKSPIQMRDIIVNPAVITFSKWFNDSSVISDAFTKAKLNQGLIEVLYAYDVENFDQFVELLTQYIPLPEHINNDITKRFIRRKLSKISLLSAKIEELNATVSRQASTIHKLASEYATLGNELIPHIKEQPINIKSAIANFDKALNLWPECFDALLGKARVLSYLEETDSAIELYTSALKIQPQDSVANHELGLLKFQLKDYPGALIALKRALRKEKNNADIHDSLAKVYHDIGLEDKSEEHSDIANKLRKKRK